MDDRKICQKLCSIYSNAKDRELECNLSFQDIKKLMLKKKCYFTGVPFTEEGPDSRSIDRLDNSKGYIKGNVVACGQGLNGRKSNFSIKEIVQLYKGIKHLL